MAASILAVVKHLLIVYHSQSGNTRRMAEAVLGGAEHPDVSGVRVRLLPACDAGPDDLLWAHGVALGTPENFGYMSGGMKDFLDRTFYPVEGKLSPLPYALFVSCGNDGRGAVRAIRRIAPGYPLKEVAEPVIARGALLPEHLDACRELGTLLAAGLEAGIF